jgi:hypothetical protein
VQKNPAIPRRKRINVVAIGLSLFMPWLLFCLIFAMLSFSWHFRVPVVCETIAWIVGLFFGIMVVLTFLSIVRKRAGDEPDEAPTWKLFMYATALIAVILGVFFGNRNYILTLQPSFDAMSLQPYIGVDPVLQRGQELMDAGEVTFDPNVTLDLSKAVGFKNVDTYCVAPITKGGAVGNLPLNSYDFWAVGKNCCSGAQGAGFACGQWGAEKGGLRVVRDEERAFYRLAVQQAESAYQIKAIHPLFFHINDAANHFEEGLRDGYKNFTMGMFAYFGFQVILVVAYTFLWQGHTCSTMATIG